MSKDPAFLFYSSDFLLGSAFLTMEECGQYIKALCWLHQHGGRLPKEKIEAVVGKMSDSLLAKFKIDEEGFLFNKRLLEETEKRNKWCESRRNNLKKAHMDCHMVNHMENANEDVNKDVFNNENAFNLIWEQYPSKTGRKEALRHFKSSVNNESDINDLKTALNNYKNSERVKKGFIQNGSTWFNNWKDWVNFKEIPKIKECKEENLQRSAAYREYKEPDWMK